MTHFYFEGAGIQEWLKGISYLRTMLGDKDDLIISFDGLTQESIKPQHIATLACLLEEFHKNNKLNVYLDKTTPVGEYLFDKVNLTDYWAGKKDYSESVNPKVLNLWRIKDEEKEVHGRRVSDYLRRTYFHNKDLSAVENSLTEAYYNIFDHAQADGNAFTMLAFDDTSGILHVAVCDFGIGIAKSVQNYLDNGIDDANALAKAIETNFTIKSASYNAGQGLSNIIDSCTESDTVCICSNSAVLTIKGETRKIETTDYSFDGTLLYYSMSLAHFDDEETIEELVW